MNHYEHVVDKQSYSGEKYDPCDNFFSFIFKNMNVTKTTEPEPPTEFTTEPIPETTTEPPTEFTTEPIPETTTEPIPEPEDIQHREQVINAYIKKCYRTIVLKCHPDKNNTRVDNNERFIKCSEYYDNNLLIGLLYVFYIYKLPPPYPLDTGEPTTADSNAKILIDRILKEIRVIQEKLL